VLLGHLQTITADRLFLERQEEQRLRGLHDAHVLSLAEEPETLLLLRRYRSRIEHSIQNKVRQLRDG
jgi:hypothetical protein